MCVRCAKIVNNGGKIHIYLQIHLELFYKSNNSKQRPGLNYFNQDHQELYRVK